MDSNVSAFELSRVTVWNTGCLIKNGDQRQSPLTAFFVHDYRAMRRDVVEPAVIAWLSSVPLVPSLKL